MPAAMTDAADGLPVPQRYWAIVTIALGIIMAVMDGAIANVALGGQIAVIASGELAP